MQPFDVFLAAMSEAGFPPASVAVHENGDTSAVWTPDARPLLPVLRKASSVTGVSVEIGLEWGTDRVAVACVWATPT